MSKRNTVKRTRNFRISGTASAADASKVSKAKRISKRAALAADNAAALINSVTVLSKISAASIKQSRGTDKADTIRNAARTIGRMLCEGVTVGGAGAMFGKTISAIIRARIGKAQLRPDDITVDNVLAVTVADVEARVKADGMTETPAGDAIVNMARQAIPLLPKLVAAWNALDGGALRLTDGNSLPTIWALRALVLGKPITSGMIRAACR